MAEKRPLKILGITNEDRGEANVFLASFQALGREHPDAVLHLASFPKLEKAVAALADTDTKGASRPVIFHRLQGEPMGDALMGYYTKRDMPREEQGYLPRSLLTPLGFCATRRAICDSVPVFVPYDEPALAEVVRSVMAVVADVDADVVVVDTLMTAGLTACRHLGVRFVCLSPNSIKEFAAPEQPKAAALWKYPACVYPCPPITPSRQVRADVAAWPRGIPTQSRGRSSQPTSSSPCTRRTSSCATRTCAP